MRRHGCILLLSLQESGCFPKYMQECVMHAYLIITVISFGKKDEKDSEKFGGKNLNFYFCTRIRARVV